MKELFIVQILEIEIEFVIYNFFFKIILLDILKIMIIFNFGFMLGGQYIIFGGLCIELIVIVVVSFVGFQKYKC